MDLIQLVLLFTIILWVTALFIALATSHGGAYITWTGNTLYAMRHAWQILIGTLIGYILIYATANMVISMVCFIILFPLLGLLIAAALQRAARYWNWLCHTVEGILRRGWQLIVGIALGCILHSCTLASLRIGSH